MSVLTARDAALLEQEVDSFYFLETMKLPFFILCLQHLFLLIGLNDISLNLLIFYLFNLEINMYISYKDKGWW